MFFGITLSLPLAFRWGTPACSPFSRIQQGGALRKTLREGRTSEVPRSAGKEAAGTAHRGPLCDRKSWAGRTASKWRG